jgi:hypothetical protein
VTQISVVMPATNSFFRPVSLTALLKPSWCMALTVPGRLMGRRELVRQNLCKLGHERTLNPVFHARRQHRRQSCRLGDPGELESILLDEVDVVGMRPGHCADLVVNQQHRGVGGCKDGFVHFELLQIQRLEGNPIAEMIERRFASERGLSARFL